MTLDEKVKNILSAKDYKSGMVNRMGCSEDWYEPNYAISHTFNEDEICSMTEKEIDALLRLAQTISDYLY